MSDDEAIRMPLKHMCIHSVVERHPMTDDVVTRKI